MSVVTFDKFGGIMPKITDPRLLPAGKAQTALNCRYDNGGVSPLNTDLFVTTPTKVGAKLSIFLYKNQYWFHWLSDVDAVLSPVANDSHERVYYTEGGVLKATTNVLAVTGGTDYPVAYYLPSPPAPSKTIAATNASIAYYDNTQSYSIDDLVTVSYLSSAPFRQAKALVAVSPITIDEYSAAATYKINQVVTKDAKTYRCTKEIAAPEVWNMANWEEILSGSAYYYLIQYLIAKGDFVGISSIDYESKAYTFTLVNSYGDEGPPANASNTLTAIPGNGISLTLSGDTTVDALYKISAIRIYRLNQDANGNEIYQLVEEISVYDPTKTYALGVHTYHPDTNNIYTCSTAITVAEAWTAGHWTAGITDTTPNASLSEVLQTTEWDGAPAGLTGLIPLPNGGLAGFIANTNTVCFSVPGFPHAWPVTYQKVTLDGKKVVGLATIGASVLVLSEGIPNAITGSDPTNYVVDKLETALACTSKRSIVDAPQGVMYASPEGLYLISGTAKNLTGGIMTRNNWQTYNSAVVGLLWEGKYLGFYGAAGFIFDPTTEDFTPLDTYSPGGYRNPNNGITYLLVNGNIVAFNQGAGLRTMTNKPGRRQVPISSFGTCKILAPAYPATVSIILLYKGQTVSTTAIAATSSEPERLPGGNLIDAAEITAQSAVTAVILATTLDELPI